MSLSYYFSFAVPASVSAEELEAFLKKAERHAVKLGFNPTTVLNIPFDNLGGYPPGYEKEFEVCSS